MGRGPGASGRGREGGGQRKRRRQGGEGGRDEREERREHMGKTEGEAAGGGEQKGESRAVERFGSR